MAELSGADPLPEPHSRLDFPFEEVNGLVDSGIRIPNTLPIILRPVPVIRITLSFFADPKYLRITIPEAEINLHQQCIRTRIVESLITKTRLSCLNNYCSISPVLQQDQRVRLDVGIKMLYLRTTAKPSATTCVVSERNVRR